MMLYGVVFQPLQVPVLYQVVPKESMWTQLTIEYMTSVADHMLLRHRNEVCTLFLSSEIVNALLIQFQGLSQPQYFEESGNTSLD